MGSRKKSLTLYFVSILINMQDLLKSLKHDEPSALDGIFNTYHIRVFNFCLLFLKDRELAREATQLLFIKIWEKRRHLSEDKPLEAQIFAITKNLAIDMLRSESRKKNREAHFAQHIESQGSLTEQTVLANDLTEAIHSAVEKLPPRRRMIFTLSRYEGLTYQEIADRLSLSPKTVEHQMGKAIRSLKLKLSDFLPLLLF